jgi:GrpB-like predicted nucleotidyltransferase (UPF0157 family)
MRKPRRKGIKASPLIFEQFTINKEQCVGEKPRIEHFGSTAVPGLAGKGIVDILIVFKNKFEISAAVKKSVSIGYFPSQNGQAARGNRVFLSSRKNESLVGDTHLHLVLENSDDSRKVLHFRNRLRRNKKLRARYLKIKKEAVAAAQGERELYTKLKPEFIEEASKLSLKD